jgi:D-alanyl-D-alanine carboxypeptidase (penicillin-binding protein 5/6)
MKWTNAVCAVLCSLGLTAFAHAAADLAVPSPPQVDARNYILIDYASGQVLASSKDDQRIEPASLTKLMTCYVVFQALKDGRLKLDDPVTISEHAWRAEGSRTFVQVGSKVPAEVLIKGMIVQSGNDATIALAERVGGTESAFVELMNQYAKRLGMTGTHFEDSSGLPSPTHYSTAKDLGLLSAALIRDFPQYYPWYSLREFVWNNIKQQNRNGLLDRDPTVDGIKTGHTDSAGYCLISSAKRQDTRLIAVVLGSRSMRAREDASAALLNYGFTFYETISVKKRGEVVLKPRVYKGNEEFVAVGPATAVNITVPRGVGAGGIETSASVQRPLLAPLDPKIAVGQLQISVGGKLVAQVPLYPLTPVARGGFWSRLSDTVLLWFH